MYNYLSLTILELLPPVTPIVSVIPLESTQVLLNEKHHEAVTPGKLVKVFTMPFCFKPGQIQFYNLPLNSKCQYIDKRYQIPL